ncbi:MAG: hypothetical protein E6K55_10375 [Gemmatimonadetes bacterium]|nr:MAG: hypothetical protein E6K55_10375 [Gemmatimonadota bacterium]
MGARPGPEGPRASGARRDPCLRRGHAPHGLSRALARGLMRFRFKPTPDQRAALRRQMVQLERPEAALDLLGPWLPAGFRAASASCTLAGAHADRFVLRLDVASETGETRAYALKVYSDDFGADVWAHGQALAARQRPDQDGLSEPLCYLPQERMLVSPWVAGTFLSGIVNEAKIDLLRRAALLAAALHRLNIAPEPPTSVEMLLADTRGRVERTGRRWPAHDALVAPLLTALEQAAALLDPADPAPVHGDMAGGQFVWTGERLVLLDLDMFGYTDPAYDVGHFLAQLERRCLWDRTLPEHAAGWLTAFRDAYLAALPQVSPRNIAFYQGLTLVRKIYTVCRKQPPDGAALIPRLAQRARVALEDVIGAEQRR